MVEWSLFPDWRNQPRDRIAEASVKSDEYWELKKAERQYTRNIGDEDVHTEINLCSVSVGTTLDEDRWRLTPERYSSLNRIKIVQAWVNRFIGNCRATSQERQKGELSLTETEEAEVQLIREAQKSHFPEAGTNQTLSALSTKYWLVAGHEEIRELESECTECRRQKAKICRQVMAPLPKIRLTPLLTSI